jgi:integrase
MGITGVTTHGFRTTFKTWARDAGFSREITEMNLAHKVVGAVEEAYDRPEMRLKLLDERRACMDAWAEFLEGGKAP